MFYSHLILTKKGPLGKVWMAATLGESKIPKSFASTAKIQVLCKNIEQPAAPFALRLSAALMLGVVRVFSRKSAIVLLDVNSIMQRLKRFQTRQERNNRGKKGYKEMSNGISLHTGEISLKEGDDVARFDSITLPISKRRRSRTYALPMLKTVQASNMRGKSLWDNQSKSSVHMGDASVGESNEVDVLQAMETLFPSVQVPRLGETLQSGLNSPNSANKPEEQKKLLYRAREQDITLSAPTAMLDNMAFDMFDEDLPVVGPPGPSLDVGNLEELWMQDLGNAEEVANAFGSASQGSSRSKLGKSNESRYMLPPIEPFEPEAHHMDILPIEEQEILPPPPPLLMEKKTKLRSVHSSPVKESTKGPEYGKNISTGTGGSKSSLKRLRRSGLLCIDDETELSPSQIRAYLNDTSDIVIPEHEPRPKGKKNRKKVTQEVSYGFPQLLSCFPNVIQEFWNEVAPEELLMAGAVPCDSHSNEGPAHPSLSGSNVSKDAENPSRCPVPAQLPEKQAVPNVEPAVPLLEELPSEIPMYLNEEDQILPNIVPNPTSVTGREGEDVEVQRGAGSNAVRTPGHLSMHSHSLGDRSISVSQPSGRAYSLRSLEAVRDRLFEEITPADRKSYDLARQSSIRKERGKFLSNEFLARSEDGSGNRLETPGQGNNMEEERFPVQGSDFQLIEETEKAETEGGSDKGPVHAIGIRTFKTLEIIRRESQKKASNVEGAVSQPYITTFNDLVKECSRQVSARTFFNVLSLASSEFIRVSQEEAYGPIQLSIRTFF